MKIRRSCTHRIFTNINAISIFETFGLTSPSRKMFNQFKPTFEKCTTASRTPYIVSKHEIGIDKRYGAFSAKEKNLHLHIHTMTKSMRTVSGTTAYVREKYIDPKLMIQLRKRNGALFANHFV